MLIVLHVVNVQSDENVDFALSMQRWDLKLRQIYFPWIFPPPPVPPCWMGVSKSCLIEWPGMPKTMKARDNKKKLAKKMF